MNEADLVQLAWLEALAYFAPSNTRSHVFQIIQCKGSLQGQRVVVVRESSIDELADVYSCIHIHQAGKPVVAFQRPWILRPEIPQMIGVNMRQEKVVQSPVSRCSHLPRNVRGNPFSRPDTGVGFLRR